MQRGSGEGRWNQNVYLQVWEYTAVRISSISIRNDIVRQTNGRRRLQNLNMQTGGEQRKASCYQGCMEGPAFTGGGEVGIFPSPSGNEIGSKVKEWK